MQLKHSDIEEFIIKNIEIISSIDMNLKNEYIREKDIFDNGYIDSFGIVSLIAIIEENYSISISNFYLNSDKIRTIKGIASIIFKLTSTNDDK